MIELTLSPLSHTWVLDLDGTIVKHNGYLIDGEDSLLDGAKDFLDSISEDDLIVIITARSEEFREQTERFLLERKIRYDNIIYNAPFGERILVNDKKPSGLETAIAVNIKRDAFPKIAIKVDEDI